MKDVLIIYHRSDFDGTLSRDVCLCSLGEDRCDTIGWDYGDPVPSIADYKHVYLVDISIKEILESGHPGIMWIDHHATAMAKWDKPEIAGYRIDGVAACRLCWQWFANCGLPDKNDYITRKVIEPLLLTLAGEYDVWDKRDPRADLLQLGLRAKPFAAVGHLLAGGPVREVNDLCEAGAICQQYRATVDEGVMHAAYSVRWQQLRWLVLNGRGNSLTFASRDDGTYDGLMLWYYDGTKVRVSLYHSKGHTDKDLSVFAVEQGGGGHKGACGFTTTLDWIANLTNYDQYATR